MTVRATLFIPGTSTSVDAWAQALAQHGLRFDGQRLEGAPSVASIELIPNDGHFSDAFRLPHDYAPNTPDAKRTAIDEEDDNQLAHEEEVCTAISGDHGGRPAVRKRLESVHAPLDAEGASVETDVDKRVTDSLHDSVEGELASLASAKRTPAAAL
jgi:hypothetical protein